MERPDHQERMELHLQRIQRSIHRMMLLLTIVVVLGVCMLYYFGFGKEELPPQTEATEQTQGETEPYVYIPSFADEPLTERVSYYPENMIYGAQLPAQTFYNGEGDQIRLSDYKGKVVVISYFASWCKDCEEQFSSLGDLDSFFAQYPDTVWLPVARLEEGRQTMEDAEQYLQYKGIETACCFDRDRTVYDVLGLKMIPTTLILDERGNFRFCYPGVLTSQSQLSAMLDYVRKGASAATEAFVLNQMMTNDGGVYTGFADASGLAAGHDILSESQGLLMEYAAEKGDAYLFIHANRFVREHMMAYDLPVWVLETEQTITVNALLDDLRMLKAMNQMQWSFGGYQRELEVLAQNIALYNLVNQRPVDFYDFQYKQAASRFTLCYADFKALEVLNTYAPIAENVWENARSLVENGYISNSFPLYHNFYDYTTQQYDTGSINMAEGLYTLYHLAEAGELKVSSLSWLRAQMTRGALFARYNTDGTVSIGYDYESPAVYALVGLIAQEVGDEQLLTQALSNMERFRVFDADSPANGAFGGGTLEQMSSYDQLMALLLYAKLDQ